MNRQLSLVRVCAFVLTLAVLSTSAWAEVKYFRLKDHPDGAINPPPYGLRFDNLFGNAGGSPGAKTTFSVEYGSAAMWAMVDTDTGIIRMFGTMYGGEDTGTGYGFGEGHYRADFVYNTNVAAVSNGYVVTSSGSGILQNHGRIVSKDNVATKAPRGRSTTTPAARPSSCCRMAIACRPARATPGCCAGG